MNDPIIPSNKDLINYQKQMQSDSDWVLDRINIIDLLSKYGEVKIVGAKALGLMIARDIDVSVVVSRIDVQIWQEIVTKLMVTKYVRKVTAVDEYNYDEKNVYNPKKGMKYSLYIEMDTLLGPDQDKNNPWEIQIHLITSDKFDERITKNLISKLDDINRSIILKLKWWAGEVNKDLLFKSKGHFKIQSTWIYEAVLNDKVDNILDLLNFLKNKISQKDLIYLKSISKYAK